MKASHASVSSLRSERSSSSEAPFWRFEIFILHANVALSIKHCVQRKIKNKIKERRRDVRILANEIINL